MVTQHHAGKTTHRYLGSQGGAYAVSASERARFGACQPDVAIDWAIIDEALARGPPGSRPLTPEEWDAARMEHHLRTWSATLSDLAREERRALAAAASTRKSCRTRRPESTP